MLQPPQPHNAAEPSPMAPPLDPIASLRAALRGHYEIEREIGQGAFATVYLARDLKHERKVALKVLHADPTSETGELRFIREIRVLARLQHPNILPLHDSGHVETLLYYVMPYVSGETLRDRIDHERQLALEVACNIARDVADALAYAHAQGVIHRDIKPENILLSAGHPVLADFGIARAIDLAGVRQLTRTGKGSPGTPAYMSPEQMIGDAVLDGRSDTYSLGCVLFEMLTGKPPFAGKEGFVKGGAAGALRQNEGGLFGFRAPVDSSRFVILPFAATDKAAHSLATQTSDGLYEAFRRWDGLNLVTDLQVNEAVSKNGRVPATLTEALALARSLGAGRLVWGHIVSLGDTIGSRAELYDVTRPSTSTKEVMIDPVRGSNAYSAAVLQLLAPLDRPAASLGGDGLTRNYDAWQAYNRGHIALRNWDLLRAQEEFNNAVTADPRYPVARLWQGQLLEWQAPFQSERWREHAERAAADAPRMLERDRLLSIALVAMAHKRYPAACEAYRSLAGLDSVDFIGWYGLGECQGLDRAVLADKSSPSQWRWRSSYDAAVKSYAHALRLEPGAHAILSFERLRRLLPTAATNPRTDDPANPTFAAYPSLAGDDTLAFVPYPVSVFANGLPTGATSTLNRALDHNATLCSNWRVAGSSWRHEIRMHSRRSRTCWKHAGTSLAAEVPSPQHQARSERL